jgi:glycosyl transferase family 2
MIAFGCAITDEEKYLGMALPGIELVAEPDTQILAYVSVGSIFRNYNLLLDQARKRGGFETLVLIHQDAEITDPEFLSKVRDALAGPDVAIVGCAGAVDVRNIAWWEGSVRWASYTHRFDELGGGEIPALSWVPEHVPVYAELGEVDSIDGFVMAFSPWAIENLRFDESIGGGLHGYDFDISMQARAAGKKVVVADLKVIHHHSLEVISDESGWIQAHMALTEKWHDYLPVTTTDWRLRARRAEAERSASIVAQTSAGLIRDLSVKELERQRDEILNSLSWRITKPLRWAKSKLSRG